MKGIEQHIKWSEQCGDPGCRVFFIGERVFRAYNESRRQETLDFLNSECYAELLKNGMVVRTWITNDVSIDGYPLIVEHEHLTFMPEEWFCFDMLKDVLAFHFRVNEFCHKYGYGIRDIGYGNVTLKNGQFCFTDFGSFRKIENIGSGYLQHGLPLAFLPIVIYGKNEGNDFLAHSLITKYHAWCTSYCIPRKDRFLHDCLRHYLHPIVSYYDMFWRNCLPHIRVRNQMTLKIVEALNLIFKLILPWKPLDWSLIKIHNVYSAEKAAKALHSIEFPYVGNSVLPISCEGSLSYVPTLVAKHTNSIKRIVLWGNFQYEELIVLKKTISAEIIVMSNDRIYTNNLYKKLKQDKVSIWVVCCNVMRGNEFQLLKCLKSELLVMQDEVYEQAKAADHSDWAEKASHFASYLLVYELSKEEMMKAKMSNFWSMVEENPDYKLFINNRK